jgi:hypothetical protein
VTLMPVISGVAPELLQRSRGPKTPVTGASSAATRSTLAKLQRSRGPKTR